MMSEYVFLSLSCGKYQNGISTKMIDTILEKTNADIILTTDDVSFFRSKYETPRLILDEYLGKKNFINEHIFDYNLKRLPFRLTYDRNEKYLIWIDSDIFLPEQFSHEKLMNELTARMDDNIDLIARRTYITVGSGLRGPEDYFCNQIRAKHKFYSDIGELFEDLETPVPIENIFFFKNEPKKIKIMWDNWDYMSEILNKNDLVLPWLEGVEIGMSLKKAGITYTEIMPEWELSKIFSFYHHGKLFETLFG